VTEVQTLPSFSLTGATSKRRAGKPARRLLFNCHDMISDWNGRM
jgi:hypothetical protein